MPIVLPAIEQLGEITPEQQSNASRLIDFLYDVDANTLVPGWEIRTDTMHSINSQYGVIRGADSMARGITAMVCESAGVESDERGAIHGAITSSGLGLVLDGIDDYSQHSDAYREIQQRAAKSEGLDRAILAEDRQFPYVLFMLGTEFKIASIKSLLDLAGSGVESGELEIFIGARDPNVWYPEHEMDDLIVQADSYKSYRRRGLRPIEPERLIGVVTTALKSIGKIKDRD